MGEQANTIPPKGLGSVDFWRDLGKGAFLAGLTNILLAIYPVLAAGNMPTHADFVFMLRTTLAIIIAYFVKNLGTNNVGQLFTKDKPVTTVPAKELEKVIDKAEANDAVG